MSYTGVPVIRAAGIPTDTSRAFPVRDSLLDGVANSGVRFLWDAAFPFSYPGGPIFNRPAAGDPNDGSTVYDVAEIANGSILEPAGSITYAGGGFDLTAAAARGSGVAALASALADIRTAFGGVSQRFLAVIYMKLPSLTDWVGGTGGNVETFFGDRSDDTQPSLFGVGFSRTVAGRFGGRRQTAVGTVQPLAAIDTGEGGVLAQIAIWRSAAGVGMRYKSVAKTLSSADVVGADNTADFSANRLTFGRPNAFSNYPAAVAPQFNGVRVYRGFLENLARSGRNPVSVLDYDWAQVQARIAASAASNGGTSLIFV